MRNQLHHLLAEAAHRAGGAPAVTYRDTTVTYADLWDGVCRLGSALRRMGLCRGDRVAVFLDKRVETVTALFATSVASGVFVPVNPVLRREQVVHILENCGCRVLVTSAERLSVLREAVTSCASLQSVIVVGSSTELGRGQRYRIFAWEQLLRKTPADALPGTGIDHDVAAILYTSGSTGGPKGVVVSHRNLIVGAESVSSYLQNSASDVILAALPLSFDAGLSQLTTAFSVGAHVVLVNYVLADEVVRLCASHRITGITAVPPLWIQLAEREWPAEATRSLRYFANTGGRLPKATLERLRVIFPQAKPYLMYGLTEAFRSTYLDPAEVDRRPDSIGKAIPNAEILIARPDGTLCEPGEPGELVHRGALVTLGYWQDPEHTAQRFRPAPARAVGCGLPEIAVWSGDLVMSDAEGFIYFIGRQDEMIKTWGYRVSPTEIEEVAYGIPGVRDAVAFGIDDVRSGQSIVLVMCPAEGRELDVAAVRAEFEGRVPLYMVPRHIELRSELPRGPSGKFNRRVLRSQIVGGSAGGKDS
jgi:acyl-CoA ligase (AMP-forming) (exosortase A-associated)